MAETNFANWLSQDECPIEDPAQAWNALTVGGYTDRVEVRDKGYESWTPIAQVGELSPHSRTSVTWPQGLSPFKPELVMEAGNRAVNPGRTEMLTLGSLSLLTTGSEAGVPLVPFRSYQRRRSPSCLHGSKRLTAQHPEYSARNHFAPYDGYTARSGRSPCLQASTIAMEKGHGTTLFVVSVTASQISSGYASASALNHLALFCQAEIQPFKMERGRKFNECHYHTLPIPRQMLESLENEIVEMKVTLSCTSLSPTLGCLRTWMHNVTNRTDSDSAISARTNPSSGSNSG